MKRVLFKVIVPAVIIAVWMLTCYPVCNKAEGFDWFLYWIIAAILFENTMERQIDGKFTADYLWEEKGILPILKVDKGLAEQEYGVLFRAYRQLQI